MHGDEGDVGRLDPQPFHEVGADVDRDDLVPEAVERVLDPGGRAERDAALQGPAAFEDGDLHLRPVCRKGITTESASGESDCDGPGFRRVSSTGMSSASRPGVPGEPLAERVEGARVS